MIDKAILFISDLHTKYDVINEQILHAERNGSSIEQVIVLGDFGFFGSCLNEYFRHQEKRFLRPVSFIEGNHEDHGMLATLANQYADVVTHLPRGVLITLGSFNALCLGGARYMDAISTPQGSEVTKADLDACYNHDADRVDLIISHDCPTGIGVPGTPGMECYGVPGIPELRELAGHFKPRLWFFGHHHRWFDDENESTRFVGLPESWLGYVLMGQNADICIVKHTVVINDQPWWQRMFGIR